MFPSDSSPPSAIVRGMLLAQRMTRLIHYMGHICPYSYYTFCRCAIYVSFDQSEAFQSSTFEESLSQAGIKIARTSVEAHWPFGVGKHFHVRIRQCGQSLR